MPPHPAKTALRRALRRRRAEHGPTRASEASRALADSIIASQPWSSARAVAAFVGVRGEPDTRPLLEAALAQGRELWLPRVIHARAGESVLVQVTDLSQLEPAGFGLLEPRHEPGERALPSVTPGGPIDLMLVPGLAFDSTGARIGFGAGHYDRLMHAIANEDRPTLIGVCFASFFNPPAGPIPIEDHDVRMHWVATDEGMTRCDTGQ